MGIEQVIEKVSYISPSINLKFGSAGFNSFETQEGVD